MWFSWSQNIVWFICWQRWNNIYHLTTSWSHPGPFKLARQLSGEKNVGQLRLLVSSKGWVGRFLPVQIIPLHLSLESRCFLLFIKSHQLAVWRDYASLTQQKGILLNKIRYSFATMNNHHWNHHCSLHHFLDNHYHGHHWCVELTPMWAADDTVTTLAPRDPGTLAAFFNRGKSSFVRRKWPKWLTPIWKIILAQLWKEP